MIALPAYECRFVLMRHIVKPTSSF